MFKRFRKQIGFILICYSIFSLMYVSTVSIAQETEIITYYNYDPYKTEENPLRGFFPYIGEYDSFPYSMEYFYVPLKELMNDFNSFTFDLTLEPNLDEIISRKHQAIFRVYLDYPDEPTGIPDFLLNGLTTYPYDEFGGGISPDYSNETLISTLESLISELGQVYDGDIRIGFIEIGLLGHWGEWHTYPHDEWFPNEAIQNRILNAFDIAFNSTKIVVRYPKGDSPELPIGYHDDSFCYETIGTESWEFIQLLESANELDKWKEEPIGGEIYPDIQKSLWDSIPPNSVQDFDECVDLTHASWLLNDELFESYFNNRKIERARDGALKLGYQFRVNSSKSMRINESIEITLEMENCGSAPFYYPLFLRTGYNNDYSPIANYTTSIQIDKLLPNDLQIYHFNLPLSGSYNESDISFKLDSPFVNSPIFFANSGVNSDGSINLIPLPELMTDDSAFEFHSIIFISIFSLIIIICLGRKNENK
ncbi:MAG: DUF4832 domain-containing protein [Candidatus Thorarchaeota archaeon]